MTQRGKEMKVEDFIGAGKKWPTMAAYALDMFMEDQYAEDLRRDTEQDMAEDMQEHDEMLEEIDLS